MAGWGCLWLYDSLLVLQPNRRPSPSEPRCTTDTHIFPTHAGSSAPPPLRPQQQHPRSHVSPSSHRDPKFKTAPNQHEKSKGEAHPLPLNFSHHRRPIGRNDIFPMIENARFGTEIVKKKKKRKKIIITSNLTSPRGNKAADISAARCGKLCKVSLIGIQHRQCHRTTNNTGWRTLEEKKKIEIGTCDMKRIKAVGS